MSVLLTGATGYVGSAVLAALLDAGHDVTALVRSAAAVDRVSAAGAAAVLGDMTDRDTVSALAAESEAVVAVALPGDDGAARADETFVEAVVAALPDGASFLRTGGVWVHGDHADITETTPLDPPSLVSWRPALDERALKEPRVRSLLIEPGIVYGRGGGVPNVLFASPQVPSPLGTALTLVGGGRQHWTTVHVDDLAGLYVTVLEHGVAGERYVGVSGTNPTVRELGEAASRRLGLEGRTVAEDRRATQARLGLFGEALLLDQQASGAHARSLGWQPRRPSLVDVIAAGEYDPATA